MSQNKDPFCLGCHWEAFHLDGRNSGDAPDSGQQAQWGCPGGEHHTTDHCDFDEACCDMDDCSVNCPSICDGFVDCDESTACTASHCEDTYCKDTGPVCFDEHCFGSEDHGLESLLGLGSLPLENDLLSAAEHCQAAKTPADPVHADQNLLTPYSTNHCDHAGSHFDCYFNSNSKDSDVDTSYPAGLNPADVLHALGMCQDFSSCHNYLPDGHGCHSSDKLTNSSCPFAYPNSEYPGHLPHTTDSIPGSSLNQGPCRPQHRCRLHPRGNAHSFSPYSRNSRSSVGSQWLSSPSETPPPTPSVLTSPEFLPAGLHVCKWRTTNGEENGSCGAIFSDSGSLQEHLITKHLFPVDGPQGHGYYCCWEGCYRPDEPFSQKSKLQGHFLTHSNHKNFKCFVCGKSFARLATLERHERSHRGEKPYTCPDCGKSFTDSSELKTHSRTHTGDKPFRCTYPGCDFQTGDSSNMSSHRLTHGERKHKCVYPGCGKSFTRPDQLKRHMRTTHKGSGSLTSPSPGPNFGFSIGV